MCWWHHVNDDGDGWVNLRNSIAVRSYGWIQIFFLTTITKNKTIATTKRYDPWAQGC